MFSNYASHAKHVLQNVRGPASYSNRNEWNCKCQTFVKQVKNSSLNIYTSSIHVFYSLKFSSCFNSSWPSDIIWWHWSGSNLVQLMACCLTAPSHYLNQCWSSMGFCGIHLWHNFTGVLKISIPKICLKNTLVEWLLPHLSGANELTLLGLVTN